MYIPLISLCSVNSVYPRAMYSAMLKVREAGVRLVRQLLTGSCSAPYDHGAGYYSVRNKKCIFKLGNLHCMELMILCTYGSTHLLL